ncbi:MAG: DUF1592 domain-containing protein [Deltaproteobacteria bacterium]|nr:DUF1592 domain-containing protein [Deltaproteobacteria bacterium]
MPRSHSPTVLALGLALGCQGVIGDAGKAPVDPDGPRDPAACVGVIDAPETGWGQLDPIEYEHAIQTILGIDTAVAGRLDEHQGSHITLLGAESLNEVAADLVAAHELGGCTTDECATEWLVATGRRAFRRALDADEQAFVEGRYADARATGMDIREATAVVTEVLLQAPQTVYTPVLGPIDADGLVELSGAELATRMALFLWAGVPDDALMVAAESGALDTPEGLAAEAQRMLDDPRTGVALGRFAVDWLGLEGGPTLDPLAIAPKDEDRFGDVSDSLRAAMRKEIEMLFADTVREGGSLRDLLTTRRAWVDDELAALYGVDAPDGGEGWVELPEDERAGILTRAAFLANYAGAEVRSPIRRGVFVIEEVLCRHIEEPPPNANDVAVTGGATEEGEVRSVRDDVDARTRGGECAACHDMINPVGFLFDHYDALGRYQTEEMVEVDGEAHHFAVNASGAVQGAPLNGALELAEYLAESGEVSTCMSEHFFESATRRGIAPEDHCSVATAEATLAEGGSLRDALVAIVTAESFRYVRPRTEEDR